MKNKTSLISAIFALLATTLMAGSLLTAPVVGQPTPGTAATNETAAASTLTEGFPVSIYSETSGHNYVYSNIKTQQQLINAINEVKLLTHPELATAEGTAATFAAEDPAIKELVSEVFTIGSGQTDEPAAAGADDEVEAEWSLKGLIKKGYNLVKQHGDVAVQLGGIALSTLG